MGLIIRGDFHKREGISKRLCHAVSMPWRGNGFLGWAPNGRLNVFTKELGSRPENYRLARRL
jgi:hypothetical protein